MATIGRPECVQPEERLCGDLVLSGQSPPPVEVEALGRDAPVPELLHHVSAFLQGTARDCEPTRLCPEENLSPRAHGDMSHLGSPCLALLDPDDGVAKRLQGQSDMALGRKRRGSRRSGLEPREKISKVCHTETGRARRKRGGPFGPGLLLPPLLLRPATGWGALGRRSPPVVTDHHRQA